MTDIIFIGDRGRRSEKAPLLISSGDIHPRLSQEFP